MCPSRPGSSSKIVFRPLTRRLCLPLKSRPIILVYWPISMRELRMSQVKRHMERNGGLHFQAIEVALQAKALKECSFPGHSDWVLDQGDNEANSLALRSEQTAGRAAKLMATAKNSWMPSNMR